MQRIAACLLLVGCLLPATGCKAVGLAPHERDTEAVKVRPDESDEPHRIVVQHVLIAYDGADIPGVTRDLEKAERVARNVRQAALDGRPFDELIRLYTDDPASQGGMTLLNWGVQRTSPDDTERGRLVRHFHETAFSLEVGEIGLVPFHETGSPFGWHVIQRLE